MAKVESLKYLSIVSVSENLILNYGICSTLNWKIPTHLISAVVWYLTSKNFRFDNETVKILSGSVAKLPNCHISRVNFQNEYFDFLMDQKLEWLNFDGMPNCQFNTTGRILAKNFSITSSTIMDNNSKSLLWFFNKCLVVKRSIKVSGMREVRFFVAIMGLIRNAQTTLRELSITKCRVGKKFLVGLCRNLFRIYHLQVFILNPTNFIFKFDKQILFKALALSHKSLVTIDLSRFLITPNMIYKLLAKLECLEELTLDIFVPTKDSVREDYIFDALRNKRPNILKKLHLLMEILPDNCIESLCCLLEECSAMKDLKLRILNYEESQVVGVVHKLRLMGPTIEKFRLSLNVKNGPIMIDAWTATLPCFEKLTDLDASFADNCDELSKPLALAIRNCKQSLQKVNLSRAGGRNVSDILFELCGVHCIKTLELIGPLEDLELILLAEIVVFQWYHLKNLCMPKILRGRYSEKLLMQTVALCSKLEHLEIGQDPVLMNTHIMINFHSLFLETLVCLKLIGVKVYNWFHIANALCKCERLKIFDMSCTFIDSEDFRYVCQMLSYSRTTLQELHLPYFTDGDEYKQFIQDFINTCPILSKVFSIADYKLRSR